MTLEVTIESSKKVKSRKKRYVDLKDVPDLIARVMQNDLYISDMGVKEVKNHTIANS